MTTSPTTPHIRTLRISDDRLLADLRTLAAIGGRPDGGVDRVAGSPADQEARRWLLARIRGAGLEAELDEHGNVLGRVLRSPGPWLLLGSHTDTVPGGGRFDGAYGVIAALEVLRRLKESGDPLADMVEIVSFHDEEGVASPGLVGSRAMAVGAHAKRLIGYLELHIEQGPQLEAEGLELGVVEAIVGIDRWEARINGQANHAGTTPMAARCDAGRAAARLIAGLKEPLHAIDHEMVGNVGQVSFLPGAANVVPGEARLVVELRSAQRSVLDRAADALQRRLQQIAAQECCTATMQRITAHEPTPMSPAVVDALERVCERAGRRWRRIVSGAGHDAASMAPTVPAGMLFVPSRGGVSHSPEEHTDDELVVTGAQALLDAVAKVIEGTGVHWQGDHPGLDRLNQLTQEEAESQLRACCASRRWALAVASGRPYATPPALYDAAEQAWWSQDESDWREAFAAHPRIGERETADSQARREQSGVAGATANTLAGLADANRAYEERFGRVFLICASGRSADEMLASLRERLNNDAETELRIAAGEQSKITRLRLERLLR